MICFYLFSPVVISNLFSFFSFFLFLSVQTLVDTCIPHVFVSALIFNCCLFKSYVHTYLPQFKLNLGSRSLLFLFLTLLLFFSILSLSFLTEVISAAPLDLLMILYSQFIRDYIVRLFVVALFCFAAVLFPRVLSCIMCSYVHPYL